jgi:hypothetical protein|uniref:Uncharacterized protein n=2 Tax=Klebsiella pneumoniae complex TaxID=3390273 RepID=A0A866WP78_9ENTR|nr:Hypothetical protein [Klebsiella quasipneumoniae]
MWPFAVIQHQIFSHSLIKQIQVLKKQQFIEFNKLFSKCPVKSLTGRIHFRCVLKWFTEFDHLNRGDMLTSEQHRCHNEKKKFQRRVALLNKSNFC